MSNAVQKAVKKVRNPNKTQSAKSSDTPEQIDARRRLEERLEDLKLKKELREFDFEFC